jgi:hypothetical protein
MKCAGILDRTVGRRSSIFDIKRIQERTSRAKLEYPRLLLSPISTGNPASMGEESRLTGGAVVEIASEGPKELLPLQGDRELSVAGLGSSESPGDAEQIQHVSHHPVSCQRAESQTRVTFVPPVEVPRLQILAPSNELDMQYSVSFENTTTMCNHLT